MNHLDSERAMGCEFTDDEVEAATDKVRARFLEPLARVTGQDARDIIATLPEDVYETAVVSYVLAERAARLDRKQSADTIASVLFFAQLRETPGCATFLALYVGVNSKS
ncbi:hypothetical protein [Streptomyces sp. NPDC127103]|uniref:hypothetical protein n=1 Tax=Streptomyces sp. NPDC127103 TaxID=3347139 RepID=UPI0036535663